MGLSYRIRGEVVWLRGREGRKEAALDSPHRIPIEDHIDLHAFSPKEVVSVVEEYLEEASNQGLRQVRIIHGRGTGTQRQMVRAALSRHPRVEAFGNAPPEAGGWGATFVLLRGP
ncbi:MAG TPA: Smr/MutS family protein [Candidatus Deferrimicrobiaceae bacterium]|jgi:DNA-nicking Smr family endonuclease|nr:Smr/MutS family protein [Candidatus Deferrimicrobiaceae bacterium]